jgi:hypothetical protein
METSGRPDDDHLKFLNEQLFGWDDPMSKCVAECSWRALISDFSENCLRSLRHHCGMRTQLDELLTGLCRRQLFRVGTKRSFEL